MNKEYNIKNLLQEHIIIVPEMQRDYVWSVTSNNVYKLLQIIRDGSTSKTNIGFIYACEQEGIFCLIDGQQRLTTLVLLAFYLSIRNNGKYWGAFQEMIAPNMNLRFTYRVRKSAEQFMKDLFLSESCPSFDDIRNLSAKKWDNDTSVENMIETLHIIDRYVQMSIFSKNEHTLDFETVIQNVNFYYTDIEQTVQGRDIYITMNSCGQPLAKHERLKPYIIAGNDSLEKSRTWNTWEDWLYRRTKEFQLDKGAVDIAMSNFLRIVYELKTAKQITDNWETAAESVLCYEDVCLYFEALIRLYEFYPKRVMELFNPAKTKDKTLYFRAPKALLQVSYLMSKFQSSELNRMNHLVMMCLRAKRMKDEDLLLFLRRYRESHLDLYSFVDRYANDSIVTSCLHSHEIRKIQIIQHGTNKTELLLLKAEELDLFYTKDYYCLLNALWNEKFSGTPSMWTEEDDDEFTKRISTFEYLFKNEWMELKRKHEEGVIDNAFLARYLLSMDMYDYYLQDRDYRILGRNDTWRAILSNDTSCRRISSMIDKLYNVLPKDIYAVMNGQIEATWQNYSAPHDARYYILKYPNSLRAKAKGWNKLWIESIWNNRTTWKSFNVAIYSAPQNWNEENGIYLFESLLAHTATELCINEWTPELPNGIYLLNGRDRHGWQIYYGEKTSREAVTESLRSFTNVNQQYFNLSPAKDGDKFVFIDVRSDYDLIKGGALLLEYLKDYPQTN
jgi:uncharacterized protein with ParB-like and HNH nuclease domain